METPIEHHSEVSVSVVERSEDKKTPIFLSYSDPVTKGLNPNSLSWKYHVHKEPTSHPPVTLGRIPEDEEEGPLGTTMSSP